MNGSLFENLNKDKIFGQRALTALCLALVAVLSFVCWQMRIVSVAIADEPCCGIIEHTHDETCIADQILVCDNDDHVHTDDCYETVWSCGLEEHRHTAECFSDQTAETEPFEPETIEPETVTSVSAEPETPDPEPTETEPSESETPEETQKLSLPNFPSHTSASSWTKTTRNVFKKILQKVSSGPRKSRSVSDIPLDNYIESVTGAGTVKIDETHYLTMVEMSFSIEPQTVQDVIDSGHKFIFDLPEEILIPDDLVIDGPYYAYKIDSNPLELAFTYGFVANGDGTYRIEIEFDEDYVQDALLSGSDYIDNALRFRCYIDVDDDDNGNGLDVEFTVDKTLHIPPDEIYEDYDIATQKTGSFTSDGKLRYEVTVSSVNGTPSTIDLTDTFIYSGSGTVSTPSSVSVVLHHADESIEAFTVPAQGHLTNPVQNEYDLSLSLPQLDAGEYYTVVYEYAVTGLTQADETVSAYNTIEATSDNGNESTSDSADYFIYNQPRKKIGKDGIVFGDFVQWHIYVNERGGNIAGDVVYDDGFLHELNETINGTSGIFVQKGWADATPGVDYEFVYNDGTNEIIGIRFLPADGSTPNTNTYHITYYTYPEAAYGETVIEHNEAEFEGDVASYDVVVTGGDIEKTADGDEDIGNGLHTMNWTVTVKVPMEGIEAGTTFTDTLSPVGHTMTQAQYNALVTALQTAWGANTVSVTPTYTGNDITGYTFTVGTAGGGYLLNDNTLDEITWHYQTTGDMTGKPTETFVNTISDGQKTLPVGNTISPHVKKLNLRKVNDWQSIFTEESTSLAFDYEDEDKTFVWVVEVTPTSGLTQYRVTDVLPEGVELLGIKVQPSPLSVYTYGPDSGVGNDLTIAADGTISGEIGQLWFYKTMASGSVTTAADGRQTVDLILTANSANATLFESAFNVIYFCQLAEDVWPANGTVHLTLNNSVEVTADGDDYGEAENTIIIDATNTEDVVGKSGSWDKNTHMITYTVDLNPSAENLLTSTGGTLDPEWLTFTDVLSYTAHMGTGTGEAILNLNSVTLEKEENGVWTTVPHIQWTARTENDPLDANKKQAIIDMRIPDSTHLRLTYSYHIDSSMSDGITLENLATVEGHADESGEHNTHIDVEDFQTSGESTYKEYRLIKIDQEDGRPLSGAVFTVYSWDSANNQWVATAKAYTTDQDGKIIIKVTDEYDNGTKVYRKDAAYYIMETTAPTGYMLPENPRPFYFWFSDHEDAPLNAPDDFMLTAADVSTSSHRVEAENLCAPDYVLDTGVFDIKPLSSFIVLITAGFGTFLITLKSIKKNYGTEA